MNPKRKPMKKLEMCHGCNCAPATYYEHPIEGDDSFYYAACNDCWREHDKKEVGKMKIEVYENFDGSKLVAFLQEDDGSKRELVRSEVGNDDLLNKIEAMNLSRLTVTFHWATEFGTVEYFRKDFANCIDDVDRRVTYVSAMNAILGERILTTDEEVLQEARNLVQAYKETQ